MAAAALLLGAVHAWADRHSMDADGISYVEIAHAYARGDWSQVANSYWSPLYSWLLAAAFVVLRPSVQWEAATAHLVNFGLYAVAVAGFHFFWSGLLGWCAMRAQARQAVLPRRMLWAFGYALFTWSSLVLITTRMVTPDLGVAASVYWAMGVMVRIRCGDRRPRQLALLGVILATGYLTKGVMLPMGLVLMTVAAGMGTIPRRFAPRFALAAVAFLVIAGPWIGFLSSSKGRLTWGDVAQRNYAFHVSGAIPWDHWRGQPPGSGLPAHPSRQISDQPAVFEFAAPIGGSYPLWYDPAYWSEGVRGVFNRQGQIKAIQAGLDYYFDLFCVRQAALLAVFIVLAAVARAWRTLVLGLLESWWLLVPAACGCGIYLLVHVEDRYVGPFVVLLWAALLGAIRLRARPGIRNVLVPAYAAALLALAAPLSYVSLPAVGRLLEDVRRRTDTAPHPQWQIASRVQALGLKPGERVAHVGSGLKNWSYWAHLAGVQIIAEIRPGEDFWMADDMTRQRVLGLLARAGARALVAKRPEPLDRPFGRPVTLPDGWQQIGRSSHYILFLEQAPFRGRTPDESTELTCSTIR
ncbi:MAG: hypothetical protein AMXMBFR13_14460 [Phycisphaerae bacterium]